MLLKIVMIFSVLIGILICIRILVKQLVKSGNKEKADQARDFERQVFNGVNGFVRTAQQTFAKGQVGNKPDVQDVVLNTILDIGAKGMEKLHPSHRERKAVERLIDEARAKLIEANANATKLDWTEAKEYVAESLNELDALAGKIQVSTAPEEFEPPIRQIIADAESIIARQAADDGQKTQDEPIKRKSFYEVLGVDRKASKAEIKKAFVDLAQKYHPDKYEHLAEDMKKIAEERFKEMNEAYGVLSNEAKRAEYDKTV